MPRVVVLPSAVVDQIAAGEVVERPASVVKELVENALDAQARSIEVAVTDGGRGMIRVADDGSGMDRDDALLALERHATSKIRDTADLVGVASFGFRGEALPAIASVSQMEIQTAPAGGPGTFLRVAAGAVVEVTEAARRQGTTVTVSQLFYNAPARRRFLRSARSEWRGITDTLTTVALTRRAVRLQVTHDGRSAVALPPAPSLRARVAALWGGAYAESLLEVDDVAGSVHVSGLIERPADVGASSRRVFLFVNGRPVRDHGIVRAAEAAYRSTLPAGARPSLILDVTVPADSVDVNVHPSKAEVRFRDRWPVERAVEQAVRRALGGLASGARFGARVWPMAAPGPAPAGDGGPAATPHGNGRVDLEVLRPAGSAAAPEARADSSPDVGVGARDAGVDAPPLVQLRRTYLMFERNEGVVLIDQHSAHERVLFERFMRVLEGGAAPSQRLLFPLTLHLGPAEADAFDEHRALFERLGFEVEGFGGHTLIVRSVPLPHPRFDAERCLRETLDALTGSRLAGSASRHERLAATLACKAAIKAGDALSPAEMRALYIALGATSLPAHDVHGRSTVVQLGWDELERRFGRR